MQFPSLDLTARTAELASLRRDEVVLRKVQSLLDWMTMESSESVTQQMLEMRVMITSGPILTSVVELIFVKALGDPTFARVYAQMCTRLDRQFPSFESDDDSGKRLTFRRLLLNRCQDEFEAKLDREALAEMSPEEAGFEEPKLRRRMLASIWFIGELYLHKMLTERIMHQCCVRLIHDITSSKSIDGVLLGNIEGLCTLLATIGKTLYHPMSRPVVDAYFNILSRLVALPGLPSRFRFMLKDVVELRELNWAVVPSSEIKTLLMAVEVPEGDVPDGMVPSVGRVKSYIEQNVDESCRETPAFARTMMWLCLEVLTAKTIFAEGGPGAESEDKKLPTKEMQAVELKIAKLLSPLLVAYIGANHQLTCLYEIQKFCFENGFPAGFMERIFHYMYEYDVIVEERFLQWRSDKSNDTPGKTLSLFQVNRFLTWLSTADTESEEEDE